MSHVSDQLLQPFLADDFKPVDYLNSTLPSLSLHSFTAATPQLNKRPAAPPDAVPLADLAAQTQTLLSQLNAQITRLSTTLTQLTDDILRSGGRLAYEVEVLRGETVGLAEVLTEGLKDDVDKFVHRPLKIESDGTALPPGSPVVTEPPRRRSSVAAAMMDQSNIRESDETAQSDRDTQPEYVSQLRTLTQVRSRLDSVVQVFGEAMQWTIPPSEISLGSSLISVSAPEPGSESHSREEKGREFAERLRNEIADTIAGGAKDGNGDDGSSYEAALARIQALRDLSTVWRGTAEEKARTRFVDGLVKLAEERAKALSKGSTGSSGQRSKAGSATKTSTSTGNKASEKGGGFLENLQRIRDNIYMD